MSTLRELEQRQPEMRPWLGVVRVVCDELGNPRWRAAAPRGMDEASLDAPGAPALRADAHPEALSAMLLPYAEKLMGAARAGGLPAFQHRLSSDPALVAASFDAALAGDDAGLDRLAAAARVEPRAYATLAHLLPIPLLHACREAWSDALARRRTRSCCACCGAWPLLVELCGIERSRLARCGRCGHAWDAPRLRCLYCGTTDHEALGTLLIEGDAAGGAVEVCRRCRGYVKRFNTLAPGPAAEVMLRDLASVALDVAAMNEGYARPPGLGHEPTC